jgi:hypothetical protein
MRKCFFHVIDRDRVITDAQGLAFLSPEELSAASRALASKLLRAHGDDEVVLNAFVHVTDETGSTLLLDTVQALAREPH